jgi:hypothetical protein
MRWGKPHMFRPKVLSSQIKSYDFASYSYPACENTAPWVYASAIRVHSNRHNKCSYICDIFQYAVRRQCAMRRRCL